MVSFRQLCLRWPFETKRRFPLVNSIFFKLLTWGYILFSSAAALSMASLLPKDLLCPSYLTSFIFPFCVRNCSVWSLVVFLSQLISFFAFVFCSAFSYFPVAILPWWAPVYLTILPKSIQTRTPSGKPRLLLLATTTMVSNGVIEVEGSSTRTLKFRSRLCKWD